MGVLFDSTELRALFQLESGGPPRQYESVSSDTRTLTRGSLFVALRGERFDGADFLHDAARKGARGAVVAAGSRLPEVDLEWFPVSDTTEALGTLAGYYRGRCGARVIGITGSSGKTTVKEMLTRALSVEIETHATPGNLNNQIGLPLSVLSAPSDAEVWVLELGSSAPGEIARLTAIAAPDDAVITTVGPAHLEGFHDEEGVLNEKLDLVRGAGDGLVVVGERPERLPGSTRRLRPDVIVAGLDDGATYKPDRFEIGGEHVEFVRGGTTYRVPVGGEHHLRDALIAAATAEGVGVSSEAVARGLRTFRPLGMRGALRQVGALTVVADCYNANPESFEAAIRYCIHSFPGRRLAAVVGSMLELGATSQLAHEQIARRLLEAGFQLIVAIGHFGPAFQAVAAARNGLTVRYPESDEEVWEALNAQLEGNEVVLVKASRGVRLERVVDRIAVEYGGGGE